MAISDLQTLLREMNPKLVEGKYFIATIDESDIMTLAMSLDYLYGLFREEEGISIVFLEDIRDRISSMTEKEIAGPFALVTLAVNSDLMAVGFLAKITDALAKKGISVNAYSAYHHDHLLVPFDKKDQVLSILSGLD